MRAIIIAFLIVITIGFWTFTQKPQPMEKKAMIVIMLGAPGSGKGTQAKKLAKQLAIPHISTGDLFRENIANQTPLGKQVKALIESGKFVSDDVVIAMLKERVTQDDSAQGYLLDGFPRTLKQAGALDAMIDAQEPQPQIIVLDLDVPDNAIVKRIVGRLSCKECGAIYNSYFAPPREEGQCDLCPAELYHRADDTLEVVMERLKVYHEQTKPLVDYYSKKGVLTTIDGDQEPDIVFQALQAAF